MKTSRNGTSVRTDNKKNARGKNSQTKGNQKNGHETPEMLFSLPSMFRGIYDRVARKVGCDPSYVSRVARGERNSDAVRSVLEAEISKAWALIGRQQQMMGRPGTRSRAA
ncbi:MAG TPA: hypothetical protein VFA68_07300 [Terriglobales bacterium]|nr:hypothetical protein [Terriglobales bacterium]